MSTNNPTDEMRRDKNQGSTPRQEPVPAASTLGTDDEAADTSSIEDRVEKAKVAEGKIRAAGV